MPANGWSLLVALVFVLTVLLTLGALQRSARLRQEQDFPDTQPRWDGLSPHEADRIRQGAEGAAVRAVFGDPGASENPYPAGTREHVLWLTSYHRTLLDLTHRDWPA